MEVLSDPQNGTPTDKLRLFLTYFLCTPVVSDAEYAGKTTDLSTLTYWRIFTMIGSKTWS